MTYETLARKIKDATNEMVAANKGKHDYEKAIRSFLATKRVCVLMERFLKRCQADGIPFNEYTIILEREKDEPNGKVD